MTSNQQSVMDVMVGEMNERVVEVLTRDGGSRFYVGNIETPTKDSMAVVVIGIEVTSFFAEDAIRLDMEQLKIKLSKHLSVARTYSIKISTNSEWFVNSVG